jgi:hypothetical protein
LSAKWGLWAALGVVIIAALMFGTVANAVASAPPPGTTYTVTVTENGLPSGTKWSAQLNGVVNSATKATITFTGVSAGSYYLYTSSFYNTAGTIYYNPESSYTYITVDNQLSVTTHFTTEYDTTFAVSPSGSGSAYPGTNYFASGSEVAVSADAAAGYTFSKWTVSSSKDLVVANSKLGATEVEVLGIGTLTAVFSTKTTSATFYETGLPGSTSWSVLFGTSSTSSTSSSLKTAAHVAGGYSWSISPVSVGSTEQYLPEPATGSMTIPNQATQEIVFVKQYQVTWTTTPSGTGTISPTGVGFFTNGSSLPIFAYNTASDVFSKWSSGNLSKVYLGNSNDAGTNATVKASTTVTAHFVSGTECTTCSLTFNEVGLPSGTSWGVSFGAQNYVSHSSSITLSGLTASNSWSAFNPVSAGVSEVAYLPAFIGTTSTGSGYWSLGQTATIEVVYVENAWVNFVVTPSGSLTQVSGWYPVGSTVPISSIGTVSYTFSSWASSGKNLTLGSTSSSSTTLVVKGPGTITLSFATPTMTVHFVEFGLPTGTVWGVNPGGTGAAWFTSNTAWVNITGLPITNYYWSALTVIYGGAGLQWTPLNYFDGAYLPGMPYNSVVYGEQAYLSFAVSGTGTGGTTNPTTANWFWVGEVLPLMASNASSGSNPTFSSWSDTAGTGTITSTSSPSTFLTVAGTGTVTAKFT